MMQWIPARLLFRIILSTQICIFKAMRSTQGEAKIKKKIYFLFDKSVKANFDICVVCCQCISDWKEGWQDRRGKPQSQNGHGPEYSCGKYHLLVLYDSCSETQLFLCINKCRGGGGVQSMRYLRFICVFWGWSLLAPLLN